GLRFCNKLWNMVAYVETVTENSHTLKDVDSEHPAETTKRALWDKDLARIEEIRTTLNRVVQPTLVQLSVFMPFVAEHLYERLFKREPGSIYFDFVKASFFQLQRSTELESDMDILLGIVSTVRSIRPSTSVAFFEWYSVHVLYTSKSYINSYVLVPSQLNLEPTEKIACQRKTNSNDNVKEK
ncbi:hypothetical protein COOONC_14267, partial [Cooperia oncophora]